MWVFIDVPAVEVELARKAGAQLHRKSGKWFFDDAKHPAADFARWRRISIERNDNAPGIKSKTDALHSADLSLHEVALLTGHTNKIIRALIEDGRFPKPIGSTGVSSRSDRWSRQQVQEWVDFHGFGCLLRVRPDEQQSDTKDDDAVRAAFFTMSDIARELHVSPLSKVFQVLREKGVFITDEDERLNNRPTDEYMETGWFGRVERYLPSKNQMIYQTVVTPAGRKEVVAIIKQGLAD